MVFVFCMKPKRGTDSIGYTLNLSGSLTPHDIGLEISLLLVSITKIISRMITSAMSFNTWIVLRAVVESRPDVGSSRNSKDGFIMISFPMHTLFLSPPETPLTKDPPMMVSWHLHIVTESEETSVDVRQESMFYLSSPSS